MKLADRMRKPVPPFFKKVQRAGLVLAAAGGTLLASPVALPAAILTLGGYMVATGSVIAAIAQATVQNEPEAPATNEKGEPYEPAP